MPPTAVKTIEDLIYWQYAKIIAASAGMDRFKKLQEGEISWSSTVREFVKEREKRDECIYCGEESGDLTKEHLLPVSRGGVNRESNIVFVCQSCNSSEGSKRLYEWLADREDWEAAKYEAPRIAERKYLKLLHSMYKEEGTLGLTEDELEELCEGCDLEKRCPREGGLNIFCLEGIFSKLD